MSRTSAFLVDAQHTLIEATRHLRADAPPEVAVQLRTLARELETRWLTSKEAADMLGLASPTTVKNWLEGGHFPGAVCTPGGHWRFPLADVMAVKAQMAAARERNLRGDLTLPDFGDDGPEPKGF